MRETQERIMSHWGKEISFSPLLPFRMVATTFGEPDEFSRGTQGQQQADLHRGRFPKPRNDSEELVE